MHDAIPFPHHPVKVVFKILDNQYWYEHHWPVKAHTGLGSGAGPQGLSAGSGFNSLAAEVV